MARLSYDFYNRDTVETARDLLGKFLVRRRDISVSPDGDEGEHAVSPDGGEGEHAVSILAGRIIETEAYVGRCDKACHAYGYRKTVRTAPLFLGPGHAYIYLIYGMYHCLNLVTEPEGEPAAVLIRGVEPVLGTEWMWRRRYGTRPVTAARRRNFLNGPGKVCQAMELTREQNGLDLTGDTLFVCENLSDIGEDFPHGTEWTAERGTDWTAKREPERNAERAAARDTGLPPHEERAFRVRCTPRIGVDYAEEARLFPWRFLLEWE